MMTHRLGLLFIHLNIKTTIHYQFECDGQFRELRLRRLQGRPSSMPSIHQLASFHNRACCESSDMIVTANSHLHLLSCDTFFYLPSRTRFFSSWLQSYKSIPHPHFASPKQSRPRWLAKPICRPITIQAAKAACSSPAPPTTLPSPPQHPKTQ
jgi:hypothetical protein